MLKQHPDIGISLMLGHCLLAKSPKLSYAGWYRFHLRGALVSRRELDIHCWGKKSYIFFQSSFCVLPRTSSYAFQGNGPSPRVIPMAFCFFAQPGLIYYQHESGQTQFERPTTRQCRGFCRVYQSYRSAPWTCDLHFAPSLQRLAARGLQKIHSRHP